MANKEFNKTARQALRESDTGLKDGGRFGRQLCRKLLRLYDGNGNYVAYPDSKENDSEKMYCGTNVDWNYNVELSDYEHKVFKNKLNGLINMFTN